VADYRLFRKDGQGRFSGVHEFAADDDAAAIRAAAKLQGPASMELWCGTRSVKQWDLAQNGPGQSQRADISS
jgi:hypothetical protein